MLGVALTPRVNWIHVVVLLSVVRDNSNCMGSQCSVLLVFWSDGLFYY